MKKKIILVTTLFAAVMMLGACKKGTDNHLQADNFELTMPDSFSDTYVAETTENSISVYDKDAKEGDFGGFAFAITAYENTSDWANANAYIKVGELKTKDKVVYDIVLSTPSDVQYDFNDQKKIDQYTKLYEYREQAVQDMVGINGATYTYGAGTHGEDLYGDVIENHIKAINENWDANQLEENNMSSLYAIVAGGGEAALSNYDVNVDGIDELFIGEIADGDWKGIIYDMYTMVDRKPVHVLSGYDRDRFFALSADLIEEYSQGAGESGWNVYNLEANSADLMQQVSFKVDTYTDPDNPYFVSYGDGEEWEQLDEEDFNQRLENFQDYQRFDYTPLSDYEK